MSPNTDPISDTDLDWNYPPFDTIWLNGREYPDPF